MAGVVAVTGATGFVGRRLVRRLRADGWRVRALVRRTAAGPELAGAELVHGALDDPASLRRLVAGAAAVVHAAGLVKARSPAELFRVNADGVKRLLDALAADAPDTRVCLVSSLAARHPELSPYAASKRAGEEALRAAAPSWTILQPPAVYGPGDRQTLAFFRLVRRGIAPVVGPEDARVSLLHVDDLAAATASVLAAEHEQGLVGEPDDGAPGGHAWPALMATAAAALGTRARLVRVPRALLHGCGLLNQGLAILPGYVPMLTPGKVRELYHPNWVCDPSGLIAATGWRPRLSLAAGFANAIAWYREQGWL